MILIILLALAIWFALALVVGVIVGPILRRRFGG
jgi:hypothetical protein